MRANLQNVSSLEVGTDFRWFFKVQCHQCGTISKTFHPLLPVEDVYKRKSNVIDAGFSVKCQFCQRVNTVEHIQNSASAYINTDNQWQSIAKFQCNGVSLIDFESVDTWTAISNKNTEFKDIEFKNAKISSKTNFTPGENDWFEYDEEGSVPVGITDLEFRIITV
ncbi:hypothetical protein GJ496_007032 [Pomphorhynchus laevis]|nr:hypothetical protein GJ496_007032 [Pomphorhynchus laevis]